MQKREKILAGALAGTLLFWFGGSMITDHFLAPLKELEGQEIRLNEEKKNLFEQQLALARKESDLKGWRALSLPPDPLDAQRLYQEWLTTLAQISGFEITKVVLDRRVSEAGTYVTIPVTIDAKAQLQELASFLLRFESVKLLHRISRCDVISPSSEGNPELTVSITAEGLSLPSAPPRTRLFPTTELAEPINKDTQSITVLSAKGFPEQPPFCIRIEGEFLNVTRIDGNLWTVQRGVEKTFAEKHNASSGVEEFPLQAGKELAQTATAMWSRSLFTKPSAQIDYKPRLASIIPPVAIRGSNWSWKLEVTGWNPAFGNPKIEMLAAPAGMELDEKTATLNWRVGEQVEIGNLPIELLVWGTNGRNSGFTASANVRVRDPNQPPKFGKIPRLRFYVGRESRIHIPATDPDGDSTRLQFSLPGGPAGMVLDPQSGELRWTPPETMGPQELKIDVEVKDGDEFQETAKVSLPVTVEEDSARFTYLTGSIKRSNGVEEAWINDRVTNRRTVVHKGDRLQVSDYELTIDEIGPTYLLVTHHGQPFRWQFEQPLADMQPVEPVPGKTKGD